MAPEWQTADVIKLVIVLTLIDDFFREPTTALAAEIRLQSQPFGLSPYDRRRLEWEVDEGPSEALTDGEEPTTPRARRLQSVPTYDALSG